MSYWDTVYSAVGYWPLQETSGDIAVDITGNGNDGTLINMDFGTHSGIGPNTLLAKSLKTSGSSVQRVVISDSPRLRGGGQITLACWSQMPSDFYGVPFSKSLSATSKDWYFDLLKSPASARFITEISDSNYELKIGSSEGLANVSDWHHFTMTYNNATGENEFYLNGILVKSATSAGHSDNTSATVQIFNAEYLYRTDVIAAAGVGMWDRVLTPSEISALFLGPVPSLDAAPSILGVPSIGSVIYLQGAEWNHHGYSIVTEKSYLEFSDDGISNWQVLSVTENISSFMVPIALEGKFIRLSSIAENLVGISNAVYSSNQLVVNRSWLTGTAQGEVAISGMAMGELNLQSGQTAGLVIPGGEG